MDGRTTAGGAAVLTHRPTGTPEFGHVGFVPENVEDTEAAGVSPS